MFPKNKRCKDCAFSKHQNFGTGYTCHLNPFKPIVMGWLGTHSSRKRNKKEQYPKKKKDS